MSANLKPIGLRHPFIGKIRCRVISQRALAHTSPTFIAMAKPNSDNRFTNIAITLILLLLVAVFAALWFYRIRTPVADSRVNYAIVGPLVISTDDYSLGTRIAIQTTLNDTEWAAKNQPAMRTLIETTLRSVDPEQVRKSGGLAALQLLLKDIVNQGLQTKKVEQILLTDFLLQTDV